MRGMMIEDSFASNLVDHQKLGFGVPYAGLLQEICPILILKSPVNLIRQNTESSWLKLTKPLLSNFDGEGWNEAPQKF